MISFLLFCIVNAIDVSISNMDSAIIDVVWCGAQNKSNDNILVMSSKGTIYLSQNNGDDWQKLAEVFHRKGLLVLQDENEKVGVVNKIQKSPIDPQLIIFLGTEFVNWIYQIIILKFHYFIFFFLQKKIIYFSFKQKILHRHDQILFTCISSHSTYSNIQLRIQKRRS